jgi:hypothetical protein
VWPYASYKQKVFSKAKQLIFYTQSVNGKSAIGAADLYKPSSL